MLERNGILKIANVGDCGLKVIREGNILFPMPYLWTSSELSIAPFGNDMSLWQLAGKINFSTSPQEHYFDCPYQLSSEAVSQTYLDAMVFTPI